MRIVMKRIDKILEDIYVWEERGRKVNVKERCQKCAKKNETG